LPFFAHTIMDNMRDYLTTDHSIELQSLFPSTMQANSLGNYDKANSLPNYDKGLLTGNLCIAATLISWVLCILLLVFGIIQLEQSSSFFISPPTSYVRVFASLLLNSSVTLCVEGLGFVHSTSLRSGPLA